MAHGLPPCKGKAVTLVGAHAFCHPKRLAPQQTA